jgi:hypothetical protein
MHNELEKICKEVSEEQGIPLPIVMHAVAHQFYFVKETMQNGLLDNILLHNFGSFKIKKQRLDSLIKGLIKKIRSGKLKREEGVIEIRKLWKARQKR